MIGHELAAVFSSAAIPQKVIMILLALAVPAALVVAGKKHLGGPDGATRSLFISELRAGGPALALLVGAFDAFHMMQTTLRLPYAPTSKDLAPGVMEIAVLIGLGAVVGLVAVASHWTLDRRAAKSRP